MPPLALGLGIAGVASAGAGVAGALINKGAAEGAAEANAGATRDSIAFQKEQAAKAEAIQREFYNQSRTDLEPFRQAQVGAVQGLSGLSDLQNPFYQQQRDISTEAIQRQLAAQGLLRSRSQGDSLSQLELGLNQQRVGILQGLAGLGAGQAQAGLAQNLGGNLAGLYSGLGQQVGSSLQQQGQVAGQARMAAGQATAQGLASLGNAGQNFAASYLGAQQGQDQMAMQQALYKKLGLL